jgi:hypothetical protein
MPVSIKGSGGGGVTLDAGAAASTTTLTLPNVNGTVLQSGTTVTVAQGGTGAASLTANNVLLGNGTSAVQVVAPGTNGNVLTSNGTTWTSAAPATPASGQIYSEIFAATGSWTAPTGVTRVRATVVGGGGGGSTSTCGTNGGKGGVAIGIYTVTPGTSYSITIGAGGAATGNTSAAGGTTSFASFCSATGGAGGTLYVDVTCGAGTGGTLRNTNSPTASNNNSAFGTLEMIGMLSGQQFRQQNAGGLTAAIAFSTSLNWAAGTGGQSGSGSYPNGGVGGAVLLEWVQ